jgi:hypothetical protein
LWFGVNNESEASQNKNGNLKSNIPERVWVAGYYRNPSNPPESKSSPEKSRFFSFSPYRKRK